MSVLFLAASVFAFNGASAANSCPVKQAAQNTEADYSKVVFVGSGDSCCQPGAAFAAVGACCKNKRK